MSNLFSDGGVIGRNPSPIGGTWAWVFVKEDEKIYQDWGILVAEPGKTITNNYTELFAAVQALNFVAWMKGWNGILHVDSLITKHRLEASESFAGIDEQLERMARQLRRIRPTIKLLAGHPTKADLAQGYQVKKNGRSYPVSKWNKWCDDQCKRLARELVRRVPGCLPLSD